MQRDAAGAAQAKRGQNHIARARRIVNDSRSSRNQLALSAGRNQRHSFRVERNQYVLRVRLLTQQSADGQGIAWAADRHAAGNLGLARRRAF